MASRQIWFFKKSRMIRVIHHFSSVSNGWDGQLDLEVRCYWYCKVGPYDRCKWDYGVPTKWPSKWVTTYHITGFWSHFVLIILKSG